MTDNEQDDKYMLMADYLAAQMAIDVLRRAYHPKTKEAIRLLQEVVHQRRFQLGFPPDLPELPTDK